MPARLAEQRLPSTMVRSAQYTSTTLLQAHVSGHKTAFMSILRSSFYQGLTLLPFRAETSISGLVASRWTFKSLELSWWRPSTPGGQMARYSAPPTGVPRGHLYGLSSAILQ